MANVRQVAAVLSGMDQWREVTLEDLVTIFHLISPTMNRNLAAQISSQATDMQTPTNKERL